MATHRGTELNNVKETWDQNERLRQSGEAAGIDDATAGTTGVSRELEQTIREEAAEYDNANKEDRILDGDRATVSGDRSGGSDD
jgi:hypothetical protein